MQTTEESVETPKASKIMKEVPVNDQDPAEDSYDNKYEFNAPQFHDFTKEGDQSDADKWFDQREATPIAPPKKAAPVKKVSIKQRKAVAPKEPNLRKKHSMTLRKRISQSPAKVTKKKINGLTIPKPFNLSQVRKLKKDLDNVPKSPFVPLAVKVSKFEKSTPDRFKTKPISKRATRAVQKTLTQPQSPFLSTRFRSKQPKKPVPSEDSEVPKVPQFKAKPLNKRILEIKDSLPAPAKPNLTIPMSPAITKRKKVEKEIEIKPAVIKANPVPNLSKPFVPQPEKRVIPVPDYKLPGDALHEQKLKAIEERKKMEEEEAEKLRQFKAHSILKDAPVVLEHAVKITEPKPFKLATDLRGALHEKLLQQKLEKEEQENAKTKEFHAQPMPSLEAFVPKKSDKPLTEVQEFSSHLEQRMEERERYENEKREKELMFEKEKEEFENIQKEQERKELLKLRKEIVHKAQPVKHFVGVNVQPSEKKLTEPQTPSFVRKRKEKFE